MYCKFIKTLNGGPNQAPATLVRFFDLPFLPQVGMFFHDLGWFSGTITTVSYDIHNLRVDVQTQDDDRIPRAINRNNEIEYADMSETTVEVPDFKVLLDGYLAQGWILEGYQYE